MRRALQSSLALELCYIADSLILCYNTPQVPLFAVCLQSSLALELADSSVNSVAIASNAAPDEANDCLTLATYRCQVGRYGVGRCSGRIAVLH